MCSSPWNRILNLPDEDHLVQFYGSNEDLLTSNVTKYLAEGLRSGDGAIVIATPAHIRMFSSGLGLLDATHHIAWLDAENTLKQFMVDGMPDWDRFQHVLTPVIRSMRLCTTGLRAYGEMVGLLWRGCQYAAAIRLEQFWNRLLSRSSINLFCGYPIDILSRDFDPNAVDALLCAHTHVVPAGTGMLEASICRAMTEVLGTKAEWAEAAMKDERFRARWGILPRSEGLILWLRRNHPAEADEVLARALDYSRVVAA